ncbi:MAG: LuxR C-terminal-related transcriptional regulator [Planctomycetota bacterium]
MSEPLAERKRVLIEDLVEMVGGTAWMWTTSTGFRPGDTPMTVGFMSGGFSEKQLGIIMEASQDLDAPMPENPPMIAALEPWRHVTRSRTDLVPDEEFYEHAQWQLYREPAGTDHYLFSLFPLQDGYVSGIGIHRKPGMADFTPRERRIVHLVVSEIDWLHRADLPVSNAETTMELSPRLRVVFALLLQGWNRKQIAEHLGLTANTVAGYQKQVYRRFRVNSQPELMSRFAAGDGGDVALV